MVTSGVVDDHQVSDNTFGLFIAYVLPGFTAIYGLPLATGSALGWSVFLSTPNLGVIDLLLLVAQATTVGIIVSTVRWLTIDLIHHRTGIVPPKWNLAALDHGIASLELLIQIHYRYYKCYANLVIALLWSLMVGGWSRGWKDVLVSLLLMALFFVASRDALRKYYARTAVLFETR